MEKNKKKVWIRLGIAAALVLLLGVGIYIYYLMKIPIYPAFQKPVDSYGKLLKDVEDNTPVIVPKIDGLGLASPYYAVLLDVRTSVSKPTGYTMSGKSAYNGADILYVIGGEPNYNGTSVDEGQEVYRGIEIQVMKSPSDGESADSIDFEFILDGCNYGISGCYYLKEVAADAADELENHVYDKLLEICRQIIDKGNV